MRAELGRMRVGIGRRTGMTDGTGRTSSVHDAQDRVTQESISIYAAGTYVTKWGYDSSDHIAWM